MTLVEFLLARLAEDEAAALAATPGPWSAADEHGLLGPDADPAWCISNMRPGFENMSPTEGYIGDVAETSLGARGASDEDNAQHIARHHPTRVLADVDAKRTIVRAFQKAESLMEHGYADYAIAYFQTLRALAQPYAGAPGWQEEWAYSSTCTNENATA